MRLSRYVKFREEKFGGVLFETKSEKVFTLTRTAAAVVQEIAAGSAPGEIAPRLGERFEAQTGALERDVAAFIAELRTHGLVED
jgi:Coenzyme PQQ synthesis protein D (PqqD)